MKMIYPPLNNRRRGKKKTFALALGALALFAVLMGIFAPHALSPAVQALGRPIFSSNNWLAASLVSAGGYVSSKQSLVRENEALRDKAALFEAVKAERDFFRSEAKRLEELMGRISADRPQVMARILSKPGYSPYDTFVIDIGTRDGVKPGDYIYADSATVLGVIKEAYAESSTAALYSSPNERVQVLVGPKSLQAEASGLGGGNMAIKLPRNAGVAEGDSVVLAKDPDTILGTVRAVSASASDSFEWALFRSPAGISELGYVLVEKSQP